MHCVERTLWFFFIIGVLPGGLLCQGAPAEDHQDLASPRGSPKETILEDEPESSLRIPIQFETTQQPPPSLPRLDLDISNLRLPAHAGPGNYLEDRRRQTESRIQELEAQMNRILAAQTNNREATPDPERESQTAIRYGLNCERGETILVCLMKKVVVLRREVSGIQRDVSELGKRFTGVESYMKELDTRKGDKDGTIYQETGKGEGESETGDDESQFRGGDDDSTLLTNGTMEVPADYLPPQDPLCPSRFERVGNMCYYVVTDRADGVTTARDFCQDHGGFLARPLDSLTLHDLANHLSRLHDKGDNQLSELWVDGQYQTKKETWRWNDGQEIDRSIWGISDTPTKAHKAGTCVLLKKELNYLAMPQDCGYRYFFVCQAEKRGNFPAM